MRTEKTDSLTRVGPKAARPWLTIFIALAATAAWATPVVRSLFLYDRASIVHGEVWRLWLGHLAHHGTSHFFWNLVVFLPAGGWMERSQPSATRMFLLLAPLFISSVLWFFDPSLQIYAGLSGVTLGLVTFLILGKLLRPDDGSRWTWVAMLLLVMTKILFEFLHQETTLFAGLPVGIRNVPLAHLAGAGVAAGFVFGMRQKRQGYREWSKK